MKNQTIQPHSSRRRALWLAGGSLVVALITAGVLFRSASVAAHSNGPAPLIALLTPHDGASLNAASLRVQALVAAVRSRNGESFVFNGQIVAGRNAGRVRRVDLALDGILLQSIDTSEYGRQFVTDFVVDLSAINEGLHLLTIKALQGNGNNETTKSVSTTFTLNRSLVLAERNRIEEAATPKPFAGFRVRGWDGQDDDDADEEDPWQCPPRFDLKGTFMLGTQSDGIDLATERVVVALGSQTKVFEPGTLTCNGQEKVCRLEDASAPFVRFIELKRKNNGRWKYRLRGVGPLPGTGGSTLSLRVGNDWGSIDLDTGERLVNLRSALNMAHQAQSLIGPAGGTVETVDGSGVHISLQIPEGALTQGTLIKMTPLASSPLPGSTALHPGVKFEPEGLQFQIPATLTYDFSATNAPLAVGDAMFLLTSPLTMLPLHGAVDTTARTLTGSIHHFSELQPGPGQAALMDLKAWADPLLQANGNLTIAELESALALSRRQQESGCAANCIDLGALADRLTASINTLVAGNCAQAAVNPSDRDLNHYLQLEALGQLLGADAAAIRPCLSSILQALIDRDGRAAVADPSDANRQRLVALAARAQALGFSTLERRALEYLDQALNALAARILARFEQARGTPEEEPVRQQARSELEATLLFVTTTGSAVLTVNPALPTFIQQAINSLTASGMTVVMWAGQENAVGGGGCVAKCGVEGEDQHVGFGDYLLQDSPPPVSLSAGGASSITTQLSPTVLRWQPTTFLQGGFQNSGGAFIHSHVRWGAKIVVPRSGTLTISSSAPVGGLGSGRFGVSEAGTLLRIDIDIPEGGAATTASVPVVAGREYYLGGRADSDNTLGGFPSGVVTFTFTVTVTFTPSP